MNSFKENRVLIIGGPNVGKTHFGGQLYGRLNNGIGRYKITSPPEDLSLFREVLSCLNEGKSAGRTRVSANEELKLEIESQNNEKTILSFPDYGGEQVKKIIEDRRITPTWKDYITNSTSWLLFIRLDQNQRLEDIVNRGHADLKVMKERSKEKEFNFSPSAFYIELLQILLHVNKNSTRNKISSPKLTVALSCWDNVNGIDEDEIPSKLLEDRLPMVKSFIQSNWKQESFSIIGLSSTGRNLSNDNVDEEYLEKGPTSFGYLQDEKGNKQKDLTKIIPRLIEQ